MQNTISDYFISPVKPSPYVSSKNFAKNLAQDLRTDPVSWSVAENVDQSFAIGSTYQLYGPQSEASQTYMADRCSKTWDGACEYLSNNREIIKSNMAKINAPGFAGRANNETIGDALVGNSAQRSFCDLGSCSVWQEQFNHLDETSPITNNYTCNNVVCKPPSNPDSNILLNKVLDRPDKHVDLLLNMYHNCKDKRQYKGTRIGQLFNILDIYFHSK